MRKNCVFLFFSFLVILLYSCATILNGRFQKIPVITSVPGAQVYVNDALTDTTPCVVEVRRSIRKDQEIKVTKKGYVTEAFTLKKKLNENTLLGIPYFFIPVAIDAGTGAIVRYKKPDTIALVNKIKTR
jgi:hypothetical protein